jgi:hypothetical protein
MQHTTHRAISFYKYQTILSECHSDMDRSREQALLGVLVPMLLTAADAIK